MQAFQARLQELGAIVKRAPAVSTPIGFAGELWGHLDSYGPVAPGQPPGRAVPLAGALSFGAFPLIEFQRNGRLANEDLKGGETELLQFAVNQLEGHIYGTTRPQGWGEALLDAFVEPDERRGGGGAAAHRRRVRRQEEHQAAVGAVPARGRAAAGRRRTAHDSTRTGVTRTRSRSPSSPSGGHRPAALRVGRTGSRPPR